MKILSINNNIYSPKTLAKQDFKAQRTVYNTLQFDTVTFSGKTEAIQSNQKDRVSLAVEFGEELYELQKQGKLTIAKIHRLVNARSPKYKVGTMKELIAKNKGVNPYTSACMQPEYNKNFSLKSASLYLDEINSENAKEVIMEATHEFTHGLQILNDTTLYGTKEFSENDYDKGMALFRLGIGSFALLETKMAAIFSKGKNEMQDENDFGFDMTVEDVYRYCGCKDEKEFRRLVKRNFLEASEKATEFHKKQQTWAKMPLKDDPIAQKRAIRQICIQRARDEEEAYRAESEISKRIKCYTKDKIGPQFYEALADALNW